MVMQVLVLAAQNSVDYRMLGVATSGSTLFRQIGGSIGVAAFGAIFANRLGSEFAARLPGAEIPDATNPEVVRQLPPAIHAPYVDSVAAALQPVFLVGDGDHVPRLPAHVAPTRAAAPRHDDNGLIEASARLWRAPSRRGGSGRRAIGPMSDADAWECCQSRPRKYRPGTVDTPRRLRGYPRSSKIGASIQPKSSA